MKHYTLLSCIESKMIQPTQLYGRFEMGQFPTGQAVTVANTLRRALLSQLPGVAITLVHIENALHEYESIPGVQEPVLDILSNLKNIVFTSEFEVFQPQIGYVRLKGPAVVRAGDLKLPFFISCVDPDQYITTLTEHGDFHCTVLINSGKHYLNHTPDSSTYDERVAILKQQKMMLESPTFRKNQRLFFKTWQQQRNMTGADYLTQVALFVQSKLTQKLLEQEKQRRFNIVRQARVDLLTIPQPFMKKQIQIRLNQKAKTQKQKTTRNWGYWTDNPAKRKRAEAKTDMAVLKHMVNNPDKFDKKTVEEAAHSVRATFFKTDGYLPVNAFFSPVTKVNYTIQTDEKRIGENACFEIWTNGSIDPRRAIHRSAKALIKLFLPFQLIEPETTRAIHLDPTIRQQTTHRIRRAEAKKRIKQFPVLMQNVDQKAKKQYSNKQTATEFLNDFKNKPTLKRRKPSKHKQPRWQWHMRQERRRQTLYTYVQPIQTKDKKPCSLFYEKRRVFRFYRMYFPLFNILDRLSAHYKLTAVQYTKLSRLNILNLDLPFAAYKFLWKHNVQNIEDLFSIHYQMINEVIPTTKKLAFYRAFHDAFEKLFYQWTGYTEVGFKMFLEQQHVKKLEEEKKQAELQKRADAEEAEEMAQVFAKARKKGEVFAAKEKAKKKAAEEKRKRRLEKLQQQQLKKPEKQKQEKQEKQKNNKKKTKKTITKTKKTIKKNKEN